MSKEKEVYISVDIEAAGSIPGEYSLLSIGACVVGRLNQIFYVELKPMTDAYKKEALEVAGLSLETLKMSGVEPVQAMGSFERWINQVAQDKRPVFVAFNATFDWSFTHWYFMKFLGHDPFGISGLDIKAYFMGKHGVLWSETVKKKVKSLYPSTTAHTHNALDDAKEQAEIFNGLLQKR